MYPFFQIMLPMKSYGVLVILGLCFFVTFAKEETEKDTKDVGTVLGIDLGTTYSW